MGVTDDTLDPPVGMGLGEDAPVDTEFGIEYSPLGMVLGRTWYAMFPSVGTTMS